MRSSIGPAGRLFFAAFLASTVGCGSDAAGNGSTNPPPGTPGPDAPPQVPTPTDVDEKPVSLAQMVSGFDLRGAFWQASQKRLFSLPPLLTSSLSRVTVAQVDGSKVTVSTLPVKGTVATGSIEVMAYDPTSDVFALVVRGQQPPHIDVVTIKLSATDATFATLSQASPLKSDGYMFNAMYPKGAGTFLAVRGDSLLTLSVADGKATWSAPVTSTGFMRSAIGAAVLDAPRHRFVAFGKDVYVPPSSITFEPTVGTASVDAPTSWSDLTLAGGPVAPPPNVTNFAWAAWDAVGQRLFVTAVQPSTCVAGQPPPCAIQELWRADLTTSSWSKLAANYYPNASKPFAVDDAGRRFFSISDGTLSATSLAAADLTSVALTQDGDLGPDSGDSAAILPDGRLLTSSVGIFRVFDPKAASPRWERFGKAALPYELRSRPTMSVDPKTGETVLVGRGPAATNAPAAVYVLATDGSAIAKMSVTGNAPPERDAPGIVFAGGQLVIAGGSGTQATDGVFDDVWTLDRTGAGSWKKAATLPTPLAQVTLRAASDKEVWALGMAPAAGASGATPAMAPIVAIDLASGTSKNVPVHGKNAPGQLLSVAPLGTCFIGIAPGSDGAQPALWRCKKDGDGVVWETHPLDADGYALGASGLHGVGTADSTRAFFVGQTTWATAFLSK